MTARSADRERTVVRPTVFGVVVTLGVAAALALRPAVADPSVIGFAWAGLAGAVVLGVLWPVVTVRRLGLRVRSAPTDLVVDQLGTLEVELHGRASGLRLWATGQEAVVVDVVAPGTVRLPFTVGRRGAYGRVRVEVGSDAPFAIVAATRTRILALPHRLHVGPVPAPEAAPHGELAGDHAATRPAGVSQRGDSVRGVRPYVTGDPSHLVHWPSTARTGTLAVRELEPPSTRAIAVVVDLRTGEGEHASATGDAADAAVEHAAARAAGLAESALDQGSRVLLCTAEETGPVAAEVADGRALLRRLALAVPGAPGTVPDDWQQVRVTPGPLPPAPPAPDVPAAPPAEADAPTRRREGRDRRSGDRRTITPRRVAALTALVAAQLYAALSTLPGDGGARLPALAAAACAGLAMFGLRSVPIRWIVRGFTVLSGALVARFGELGIEGGLQGSWTVLAWLAATAAALTLAPSSRSVAGAHGIVLDAQDLDRAPRPDAERLGVARRATVPVAVLVASVALVGAVALLVGPRVANAFPAGSKAGDVLDFADRRGDNVLAAADALDMTRRPRLSDRVVMSVRSPITSFWRTEVFDVWDGSRWTRSRGNEGRLVGDDGTIRPDAHDLAATRGEPTTQEVRIEAGFATALPSAAAPVWVDSPVQLAQRSDGTLVSPYEPLGRGSTYTVRSRQVRVDADALRRAGDDVPAAILDRYASPPRTTERVRRLAEEVTAGATNDYDRIRAIEAWMDEHTEYSLDAPLSPRGVDVVDHFLFEERLGWCEQIASSLVVMARSVGIPARVATGFAPGEWDGVTQRFVVRERDAHAWAEVWFPGAGWVPFDPTASVPLAGTAEATAGAAAYDLREVLGAVLLAAGVVALSAGSVRRRVERWGERWRARRRLRRLRRTSWDVAEELRIEQVGAAAGRPRRPGETVATYSAVVAELVAEPELARVGAEVDRARYARGPQPD